MLNTPSFIGAPPVFIGTHPVFINSLPPVSPHFPLHQYTLSCMNTPRPSSTHSYLHRHTLSYMGTPRLFIETPSPSSTHLILDRYTHILNQHISSCIATYPSFINTLSFIDTLSPSPTHPAKGGGGGIRIGMRFWSSLHATIITRGITNKRITRRRGGL